MIVCVSSGLIYVDVRQDVFKKTKDFYYSYFAATPQKGFMSPGFRLV